MRLSTHAVLFLVVLCSLLGCKADRDKGGHVDPAEPRYLSLTQRSDGGWIAVSVSPFDGSSDTLVIDCPLTNLIVMSTSHVGFLDALDALHCISGVSGPDFIYTAQTEGYMSSGSDSPDSSLRSALPTRFASGPLPLTSRGWLRSGLARPDDNLKSSTLKESKYSQKVLVSEDNATLGTSGGASRSEASEPPIPSDRGIFSPPADVGYDSAPDYEKIVGLKPDLLLTYAVSGAKSPFITKLEQLGIPVFIVNEHLESHPLARASYIRLFGALTGRMPQADSIFTAVKEAYSFIADSIATAKMPRRKVLLNIPYNDQWFVPSTDSYLTSLIRDAGGEVLGCEEGRAASSVMPVEKAYSLSKEADCWLNVGWCTTLPQLLGVNPIFEDMVRNIRANAREMGYGSYPVIWNDNKRVNAKGGNDIWQSGVARPDLLLQDLVTVLHPDSQGESTGTIYYRPIN